MMSGGSISGVTARILLNPNACAFMVSSSMARVLISSAQIVLEGLHIASVRAIGPHPQPKSKRFAS